MAYGWSETVVINVGTMRIPQPLIVNCQKRPERMAWMSRLPSLLGELEERWSLRIDEPV